jgi:dienelactone hydrolase
MHVEDVEYEVDGTTMVGRLAYDETRSGRRPGVLLCHEAPGLDEHVKGRAERLAGLGYTAFALDCWGGGQVLAFDDVMPKLASLMAEPERMRGLGRAALNVLRSHEQTDPERMAAIGYCMGGAMALELARGGEDLKAVVGFHPSLDTARPEDARNITASVAVCCGTADPFISRDQRIAFEKEMTDGGVADWRMDVYGGVGHSFTNPRAGEFGMPGIAYHKASDERSWRTMLGLFDEKLGAV